MMPSLYLVLRLLKGARGSMALSVVLAGIATALELVPYVVVTRAVVELLGAAPDAAVLSRLGLLAGAAVLGRFVTWALAMYVSHVTASRVGGALRLRVAEHLVRLPLGSVDAAGPVKTALIADVDRLEAVLAHTIPEALSAAGVWVSLTVWLLAVDWRMALASIAVVPVAFLALRMGMRGAGPHLAAVGMAARRTDAGLVELLRGAEVLRVFSGPGAVPSEVAGAIDAHAAASLGWARSFFRFGAAFFTLAAANAVVILPVGAWLRADGAITDATLVLFTVVGLGHCLPLLRFYRTAAVLTLTGAAARTISDVLAITPLPDNQRHTDLTDLTVTLRNVRFTYTVPGGMAAGRREAALDEVSFAARPGELTALVGPSGAGKSTVARLVARFHDVDGGSVAIGGVDVREMGVDQLMALISVVFQDTFLFSDTIRANLLVAQPTASDTELRSALRAAAAEDLVAGLPGGLDTVLSERGANLSGGERQRLAIARALLADRPIVVLDEATAFADAENEAHLQASIAALLAGRTVIVVAHRLSTIVAADQIVVLDRGRVVARGTHQELLARPGLYPSLWADHVAADERSLGDAVRGSHEPARGPSCP